MNIRSFIGSLTEDEEAPMLHTSESEVSEFSATDSEYIPNSVQLAIQILMQRM